MILVMSEQVIFMPKSGKLLQFDSAAYCSAPPLQRSQIPPRSSREAEACCPRPPLRPQEAVKAEISTIESIESVDINGSDIKPVIPFDPRQINDPLQLQVAALKIEPRRRPQSRTRSRSRLQGHRSSQRPGASGAHSCAIPQTGTWVQQTPLGAETGLTA